LTVISPGTFEFRCVPKCNDTANVAYHCTTVSLADGPEVIGMLNRRGRLCGQLRCRRGIRSRPGSRCRSSRSLGTRSGRSSSHGGRHCWDRPRLRSC
jgi:hypothetical protein